jgi:hypothetical protein
VCDLELEIGRQFRGRVLRVHPLRIVIPRAPMVESKPPVSRPQKGSCRDARPISLQSLESDSLLGC